MVRLQIPATRITHHSESSIDWICTNISLDKLSTEVINARLSDHTAQICTIDCNSKPHEPVQIRRNFGKKNLQNLKLTLAGEDWNHVYETQDTEEAFKIFNNIVSVAMNSTCPHRKSRILRKPKQQFNLDPEAKRLKDKYLRAVGKFERTGNANDKRTAAENKKNYDLHLKLMRRTANADHINNADNKSKAMWDTINTVWSKKASPINKITLQINGVHIDNASEVAEHLNLHFTNIAEKTL